MYRIATALALFTAGCQCHDYRLVDSAENQPPDGNPKDDTPWAGLRGSPKLTPTPKAPLNEGRVGEAEPLPGWPSQPGDLVEEEGCTPGGPWADTANAFAMPPLSVRRSACEGSARWLSGALRSDPSASSAGLLQVDVPGTYHLYVPPMSDGGPAQRNESGSLRVGGLGPHFASCGDDWIVTDVDNGAGVAAGALLYAGTFFFEAGANEVSLAHACSVQAQSGCRHGRRIAGGDRCKGDPGDVVLDGAALCLVPAE